MAELFSVFARRDTLFVRVHEAAKSYADTWREPYIALTQVLRRIQRAQL